MWDVDTDEKSQLLARKSRLLAGDRSGRAARYFSRERGLVC
jgi:tetrahydromethanopterin S-methyltransferase subunit F